MLIDIITGFPGILEAPLNESMIKIGRRNGVVDFRIHDLRDFTTDKHRTIDDYPYGGGPGMVLKPEPISEALDQILENSSKDGLKVIMPSPRGGRYDQTRATKLSLENHLVFLCGHYKGIDQRILDLYPIEEISIGDYILSSGELASLVIIDSIVRLLPGVLKDIDSAWTDSFSDHLLDAPYYTRPEKFKGIEVPGVLLSGDHKKIEGWRQEEKIKITRDRRPDLYEKYKNQ